MLSDPLISYYNFAAPTWTAGSATTLRRTANGRYIGIDAGYSLDQPARLIIVPNVKAQGISTFTFRLESDVNLNPVNGIQQLDDTIRLDNKLSGNLRSMTVVRARQLLDLQYHISYTQLERIMAGES